MLGCDRGHAEGTHASTPVVKPPPTVEPVDSATEDPLSGKDQDEQWVPMDGSEKVIVDKLGSLVEGTAVRAEPAYPAPPASADARANTR
jgi:hypothetical protein